VILYHYKKLFSTIPTESIIRDNQEKYYQALEESGSMGESTPFIEFMLEIILESLENVPKNVTDNVPKDRVEFILYKMSENKFITIKELAEALNVNEKTVKRDIEKLKEKNKIQRVGSARKGEWIVVV
jgi:Fic family protein